MVMIRPLLRANAHRKNKTHIIVFFIFLVANIGGSLTPLGDPPLFLGFLHGVPFFWTMGLIKEMIFVVVILLAIFYVMDRIRAARDEAPPDDGVKEPLRLYGWHNFFFLGGILGFVLISGLWDAGTVNILGVHEKVQNLVRDGGIVLMGLVSLWTTRREWRRENEFSWGPILEVAYLFAGIFMTIIPALAILRAGEAGALAGLIRSVREPWHYFWITGGLSAFLDNAPTYLTFFSTALGSFYPGVAEHVAVHQLIDEHNIYLVAISIGAVFMGACTYIGNAPNFMVKSIAEEAGIPMPSFFGYVVRWTLPVLVPVFVLVTFVFLV
jgi:Na+/H+ antiporter NhaD/arsenite permease-like protein